MVFSIKNFLATVKAVAWAFLGIRSGQGYDQDVNQLRVTHVIAVGVIMAFVFVAVLMLIINLVVLG